MQYLNDNMDELFCSAAEHYTLKLKEDGWDAVVAVVGSIECHAVADRVLVRRVRVEHHRPPR